jgi:dipeptidyl-peptidase-4
VAVAPPFTPKMEFFQVGKEGFNATVIRPQNAKPGVKLPVIVYVYGGPTVTVSRHGMAENLLYQWFADHGFLVVKIDGRGTPMRTAAWQRAVKYDFATLTLDDQITALKALAEKVPELDLSRVGVYGWSFGGYMAALAALKRPDVFKAAVAGAPVVDWLDYDTHYTERYLGLPQEHPEAYKKSSLLTYAEDPGKPIAPLLLIHGTADDNVYFFHTLKLSHALFLAGKPHDLLPLSGLTHMVPDPLVTQRQYERVLSYFQKHL